MDDLGVALFMEPPKYISNDSSYGSEAWTYPLVISTMPWLENLEHLKIDKSSMNDEWAVFHSYVK